MQAPRLLDLFCGAGGAAAGYAAAGFDVTGVDASAQPRYPFRFIRANALDFPLDGYAVIHASPPCQAYSKTRLIRNRDYPDLIARIRQRILSQHCLYVIENVPQAPLLNPVILCGSHFGLTASWPGTGLVGLRRHRAFEVNFFLPDPGPHDHSYPSVPVFGHSAGGNYDQYRGKGFSQLTRKVMGIDWMKRQELSQAIPPAFTEYVGKYLASALRNWSHGI
jgi:DNA (cytosine-5)-methyltransferase 1